MIWTRHIPSARKHFYPGPRGGRSFLASCTQACCPPSTGRWWVSRRRTWGSRPPSAPLARLLPQGVVVRRLLSPASAAALPAATLASRLAAAYQPVSAHLDSLILRE